MKNKKIIIGFILLILLIGIIIGIFFLKKKPSILENNHFPENSKEQNENIKYNTNEKIIEDKTINNITFTNITCSFDGTYSILEYTITNHTTKTLQLEEYEIIVIDKNNKTIANLALNINYELAPEESYQTGNAIDLDLSDAASIEIVSNEE